MFNVIFIILILIFGGMLLGAVAGAIIGFITNLTIGQKVKLDFEFIFMWSVKAVFIGAIISTLLMFGGNTSHIEDFNQAWRESFLNIYLIIMLVAILRNVVKELDKLKANNDG